MVIVGTCSFLLDKVKFIQDIVHYETLPHNLRDRDYQIACAVLCWFLAFLETVIVCCCFREIKICKFLCNSSHWHFESCSRFHSRAMANNNDSINNNNFTVSFLFNMAGDSNVHIFFE